MAQEIKLKIGIDTAKGNRSLKELRGTLKGIKNEVKNFNLNTFKNEFRSVGNIIDSVNKKLDKFGKKLSGKELSMGFNASGSSSSSSIKGGGINQSESFSTALKSTTDALQRSSNALNKIADMLNKAMNKMSGGGGGNNRMGSSSGSASGRGGGFSASSIGLPIAAGAALIGTQIESIFKNQRVKGAFSNSFGSLFGEIGSILGSRVSSIASDIGKVFGNLGEIAFNMFTLKFRLIGIAIGGILKGAGAIGAVAFFAGFTGPIGLLIAGIAGLFQGLISVVSEVFKEIKSVITNIFKSAMSIISASIKAIVGVFKSIGGIISSVWKGMWEGLKGIARGAIEIIKGAISTVATTFKNLAVTGTAAFNAIEMGAARSAKEIVSVFGRDFTSGFERIISDFSTNFGQSIAEVQEALFNISSAGALSNVDDPLAEASKFLSDSSRLALADGAELGAATNALLVVMENYGDKLTGTAEAAKLLAGATTVGVTNLNELGPALANVIGPAAQLGFTLDDTLAATSKLTRALGRGKAQSATKFLARFFEALAVPTGTKRKELEELGFAFGDLFDDKGKAKSTALDTLFSQLQRLAKGANNVEAFRNLFPTIQARRAAFGLLKDTESFAKIREDMQNVNIEQQIAIQLNTVGKRLTFVKQALKNITAGTFGRLGNFILRSTVLTVPLVKKLRRIADVVNNELFSKKLKGVGKLFIDAFKPITDLVGKAATSIETLLEGFGQGGNIGPLENIAAALKPIVQNIADFLEKVFTLENAEVIFVRLSNAAIQLAKFLGKIFTSFETGGLTGALQEVFDAIPFAKIGTKLTDVVISAFRVAFLEVIDLMRVLVNEFKMILQNIDVNFDGIKDSLGAALDLVIASTKEKLFGLLATTGIELAGAFLQKLKDEEGGLFGTLKTALAAAATGLESVFSKGETLFSMINIGFGLMKNLLDSFILFKDLSFNVYGWLSSQLTPNEVDKANSEAFARFEARVNKSEGVKINSTESRQNFDKKLDIALNALPKVEEFLKDQQRLAQIEVKEASDEFLAAKNAATADLKKAAENFKDSTRLLLDKLTTGSGAPAELNSTANEDADISNIGTNAGHAIGIGN